MQRSDPKDAGKSIDNNGGQQQQQVPVQHYVLASQIQALTSQGIISGLHGTSSASLQVLGGTSPSIQQPPTVVVISTSATSQTSTILTAQHALQQELVGQGLVGIVTQDGQPLTISSVSSQLTGRVGELQIGQPSTTGGSGRTIHHHGQSPLRGSVATPHTNLQQQSLLNMNNNQTLQQKTATTAAVTSSGTSANSPAVAAAGRVLLEAKPSSMSSVGRSLTFPNLTAFANQSTSAGPSPKKKIKIEENVPASAEIAQNRKLILDHKYKEMSELKENYIDCLTELFFLQNGGNMMDYFLWKKRPTPQLVHFLKSGNLDSDEDEEQGLERKINNEVKVITCSGSNVPIATPVAISTTLPPSVAALNQQGTISSSQQKSVSLTTSVNSVSTPIVSQKTSVSSATTTTVTMTTSTSMSQLQSHLAKAITDIKPLSVHTSSHHKAGITTPSFRRMAVAVVGTLGSFLDLSDIQREEEVEPLPGPSTSTPVSKTSNTICNICGKTTLARNFRRHMRLHDMPENSHLKCKKCSMIFTDETKLDNHSKTHTSDAHICNHCGKSYKRKSAVTEHIKQKHVEGFKSFLCHICSKSFSRISHLQNHLNTHSKRYPYICKCSRRYAHKTSLAFHQKNCNGLAKNRCDICSSNFSSTKTLKEHVASVHNGKRFTCKCGNSYKWRQTLRRHEKKCHY